MPLDPRTPVIVGAAQLANKDEDRIVHPVELLADAVDAALADAGVGRPLLESVGRVYSTPLSVFSEDDAGRMLVERFGLGVADTFESRYSGASPQRMTSDACSRILAGDLDAALIVGGVAEASVRRARRRGLEPPAPPTAMWSQGSGARADGRRMREGLRPGRIAEMFTGGQLPVHLFSMLESAIAAVDGRTPSEHRQHLARLLAGFTEVAATQPDLAWFPTVRSADDIATPRPDNRSVTDWYTKVMCSFPTVDLAAAVLVCSVEVADRLGVPEDARVFPWSIAAAADAPPAKWPRLDRARAMAASGDEALSGASTHVDEVAVFDLYSCFPAAVELALGALGLSPDDPRRFTLTGGLPYFGGPGASYSLHAMVSMVGHCRDHPADRGLVVGLGGMPNDFGSAVLAARPPTAPRFVEAAVTSDDEVPTAFAAAGPATCEAMTFGLAPDGRVEVAPLFARLSSGERIGARPAPDVDLDELVGRSFVGASVELATDGDIVVWRPI